MALPDRALPRRAGGGDVAGGRPALGSAREYLYVENTLGGDISVIEIPTHRVVGTIPASVIGEHPDDIISTRDGGTLFLSRLDGGDVIAVSTEIKQRLWKLDVGGTPNHAHPSLELLGTVTVGAEPNWVVFSKDSRFAYVSNRVDDTISVIDLAARREATRIKVGDHPQRMTVATVPRRPSSRPCPPSVSRPGTTWNPPPAGA